MTLRELADRDYREPLAGFWLRYSAFRSRAVHLPGLDPDDLLPMALAAVLDGQDPCKEVWNFIRRMETVRDRESGVIEDDVDGQAWAGSLETGPEPICSIAAKACRNLRTDHPVLARARATFPLPRKSWAFWRERTMPAFAHGILDQLGMEPRCSPTRSCGRRKTP